MLLQLPLARIAANSTLNILLPPPHTNTATAATSTLYNGRIIDWHRLGGLIATTSLCDVATTTCASYNRWVLYMYAAMQSLPLPYGMIPSDSTGNNHRHLRIPRFWYLGDGDRTTSMWWFTTSRTNFQPYRCNAAGCRCPRHQVFPLHRLKLIFIPYSVSWPAAALPYSPHDTHFKELPEVSTQRTHWQAWYLLKRCAVHGMYVAWYAP